MDLVLKGRVVTFDTDHRVIKDGAVYIHNGVIEAIQPRSKAAPAGFGGATEVATGGVVYPGLVDLHNHLAYNFLPLWSAPKEEPYTSRHQWPGAATYGRDVSNPAQAMGIAAAAAALRYAEVRAVVGGVTSIQGSPPLTRAFPGWMVRNIEKETFADGLALPIVQAVIKADVPKLKDFAKHMKAGSSFIYHLAEGTDPKLVQEYRDLKKAKCVSGGLIGIHSTALADPQYSEWGKHAGAVVWSPFSNLWLYGDTTDVLSAGRHGHLVCLGSDWGPSGTKNLLGELKVASLWNDEALGGALSAEELCATATANPGDALVRCWGKQVGRLQPGALADLMVTSERDTNVYKNLLRVSEKHVRLVVVGGRPAYGSRALMEACGSKRLEKIRVAGADKAIAMKLPDELLPPDPLLAAQANLSWRAGLAAMRRVVKDPAAAVRTAKANRETRGPAPLEFIPDMPGPDDSEVRALDDTELDSLAMVPIESLEHDAAWFSRVDQVHAHGAILKKLRARFR